MQVTAPALETVACDPGPVKVSQPAASAVGVPLAISKVASDLDASNPASRLCPGPTRKRI
jgi:hypothetical protein